MPIELGSAYGKIIIDASGVKKGTGEAKKEVGDFEKGFASAGKAIAKTTGLITGEIAILKKVFDFGREGAVATQTAASFDTLMASIQGPKDLLEQLRRASRDTVPDMTLMSATTTLLAGTSEELGRDLANNAAGILEIAKAANKLNPNLGSTEFLYQSLMTGIKRGSPMIIDNTGITLKLGEAYEALAKELGKGADELTSEEQKMAILRATMEAGDRIIEQVGGDTEAATDSFDRMTTAIANQGDALKAKLLPPLQDAADAVTELLTWDKRANDALVEHEKNVRGSSKSWDEYAEEMIRAAVASGKISQSDREGIEASAKRTNSLILLQNMLHEYGIEIEYASEASYNGTQINGDYVDMQERLTAAVADSTTEINGFTMAVPKTQMSLDELRLFMEGPLGAEMDSFNLKQGDLTRQAGELKGEIEELSGKAWLTAEQKTQLEENKTKLKEIQDQIRLNAEEHERATKKILFDLLQQQLAIDGLTTEEGNVLAVVAEKWGLVDEKTATAYQKISEWVLEAKDGKITIDELVTKMSGLSDHDYTITTYHRDVYLEENQRDYWNGPGRNGVMGNQPEDREYSIPGGSRNDAYASGGMMASGRPAIVGENGIEVVIPNSTSTVVPNDQVRAALMEILGGGSKMTGQGGGKPVIQIYVQGDGMSEEGAEALAYRTSDIVLARLAG